MRKLFAFLKRDFLDQASYKFMFISSFFSIFLSSATFYFVAQLISGQGKASLEQYGGDYYSFVIIGIAFSGILSLFRGELSGIIRSAQMAGTLEAILVTRTPIPVILLGSSLYSLIFSLINTGFHLTLAIFLFGMRLGRVNVLGALIIFVLTALSFLSIGILSASFILIYKKGNPFDWIYGGVSSLLGGVVFPIELLPAGVRQISYLLPITYSLDGLRKCLLASSSLSSVLTDILALTLFVAVLLPVSLVFFRFALRKAKRDGTLTHY